MIAILSPSGQHVRFITDLILLIAGATIYVGARSSCCSCSSAD
jgi:hypothetical protein